MEIFGTGAMQVKETSTTEAQGRKELDSFKEYHKECCSWDIEKVGQDELGEIVRSQSIGRGQRALNRPWGFTHGTG